MYAYVYACNVTSRQHQQIQGWKDQFKCPRLHQLRHQRSPPSAGFVASGISYIAEGCCRFKRAQATFQPHPSDVLPQTTTTFTLFSFITFRLAAHPTPCNLLNICCSTNSVNTSCSYIDQPMDLRLREQPRKHVPHCDGMACAMTCIQPCACRHAPFVPVTGEFA